MLAIANKLNIGPSPTQMSVKYCPDLTLVLKDHEAGILQTVKHETTQLERMLEIFACIKDLWHHACLEAVESMDFQHLSVTSSK